MLEDRKEVGVGGRGAGGIGREGGRVGEGKEGGRCSGEADGWEGEG